VKGIEESEGEGKGRERAILVLVFPHFLPWIDKI